MQSCRDFGRGTTDLGMMPLTTCMQCEARLLTKSHMQTNRERVRWTSSQITVAVSAQAACVTWGDRGGADLFVSQGLLGLGSAHGAASPVAGAAKGLLHGALSAH